jgi:hypothetical protein
MAGIDCDHFTAGAHIHSPDSDYGNSHPAASSVAPFAGRDSSRVLKALGLEPFSLRPEGKGEGKANEGGAEAASPRAHLKQALSPAAG